MINKGFQSPRLVWSGPAQPHCPDCVRVPGSRQCSGGQPGVGTVGSLPGIKDSGLHWEGGTSGPESSQPAPWGCMVRSVVSGQSPCSPRLALDLPAPGGLQADGLGRVREAILEMRSLVHVDGTQGACPAQRPSVWRDSTQRGPPPPLPRGAHGRTPGVQQGRGPAGVHAPAWGLTTGPPGSKAAPGEGLPLLFAPSQGLGPPHTSKDAVPDGALKRTITTRPRLTHFLCRK